MTIIASDVNHGQYANSATFTAEKTSAFVSVSKDGRWNVCSLNASHRAWRGSGKFFASFDLARAAYKSGEMKAILGAAKDALTTVGS